MCLRLTVLVITLLLGTATTFASDRVLVFTAASMKDAIETIATDYETRTGKRVVVSLASSGTLARQIEAGAPADLFLSASSDWMDYLAARDLIDPHSRSIAAGNSLVIVRESADDNAASDPTPQMLLTSDRFAMGDPVHVPAGIYAKQGLQSLGWWDAARQHAAFGENVRVALAMAARGDVGAAIVYRSDAAMREDLDIVYQFPEASHLPIRYPVALTQGADADAHAFLVFLLEQARAGALMPFGFALPPSEMDVVRDDR